MTHLARLWPKNSGSTFVTRLVYKFNYYVAPLEDALHGPNRNIKCRRNLCWCPAQDFRLVVHSTTYGKIDMLAGSAACVS